MKTFNQANTSIFVSSEQ